VKKLYEWIKDLPSRMAPKGMKWSESILSPYFWFRQIFHLLGGLTTAFIGGSIPYWCGAGIWGFVISGALLSTFVLWQETGDLKKGQSWYKTAIDYVAWMVLGFLPVAIATLGTP